MSFVLFAHVWYNSDENHILMKLYYCYLWIKYVGSASSVVNIAYSISEKG